VFQDWITSTALLETGTTILLCLWYNSILVGDSTCRWTTPRSAWCSNKPRIEWIAVLSCTNQCIFFPQVSTDYDTDYFYKVTWFSTKSTNATSGDRRWQFPFRVRKFILLTIISLRELRKARRSLRACLCNSISTAWGFLEIISGSCPLLTILYTNYFSHSTSFSSHQKISPYFLPGAVCKFFYHDKKGPPATSLAAQFIERCIWNHVCQVVLSNKLLLRTLVLLRISEYSADVNIKCQDMVDYKADQRSAEL